MKAIEEVELHHQFPKKIEEGKADQGVDRGTKDLKLLKVNHIREPTLLTVKEIEEDQEVSRLNIKSLLNIPEIDLHHLISRK